MTTTRFKVGLKVILNSHDCVFAEPGETVTVTNVDSGMLYFRTSTGSYCEHSIESFEDGIKSLDNLEVGDLIEAEFGQTKMVIDVFPNSVALSKADDLDVVDALWSVAELKARGWTVKQDTPPEEITELSIAELEKKLDLTAGTLRVKKD